MTGKWVLRSGALAVAFSAGKFTCDVLHGDLGPLGWVAIPTALVVLVELALALALLHEGDREA